MRALSPAEIDAFLRYGTRTLKVATLRPDGAPHVVPVWFVVDGDDLVFTTSSGSVKARNLRADPRISACVDDHRDGFSYVTVFGVATLIPRPADHLQWTTRIAGRYVGADQAEEAGRRYAEIDDLIVRIGVTSSVAYAEI